MATTTIINGENVRVSETSKGTIYSKNFRSFISELRAKGTDVTLNKEKHSFFICGNAYYVGPSLQGENLAGIKSKAHQIQVNEQSLDGERWVPCLFLPTQGESDDFSSLL